MLDDDPDNGEPRAIAASREYFRQGGEGITFEQVVADLDFAMDQVRSPERN